MVAVQGVIGIAEPIAMPASIDQAFIDAVRGEFATVVARQPVPDGAPLNLPHLMLQSTTSQLAVSAARADFQKQFYGEWAQDPEACFGYAARKLRAVLAGWDATPGQPSFVGVVLNVQFPFEGDGPTPVEQILTTMLRQQFDPSVVQDAQARVGVRLDDRHFVTLHASNYENKLLERPVLPGPQIIDVKPWEGRVEQVGVSVAIDVNNRLDAINRRADPAISVTDLDSVLGIVSNAARGAARTFVETGSYDIDALIPHEAA